MNSSYSFNIAEMKSRITLLFLSLYLAGLSQNADKPKLVVGVVVDQMRNDYIYRYWNRYGEGGFKRIVKEGFFCKNTHYNYVPTYTGPGHSSIYTGATPQVHGIIANDWFVKETKKEAYCCEDPNVKTVGSDSKAGLMSPHFQLSTTVGDELKLFSNGKSKVIGVALKDRSSILPVGHAKGSMAFWYDDVTGNFISSTWYMNELPNWVQNFNAKKLPKTYLEKGWNTLYAVDTYTNSISDDNRYEAVPNKKEKPVFPYEYITFVANNSWSILKATPYGNTITKDIALEALKAEALGKDEFTDMLCISFSSTDIIGHSYGIRSVEIEDVYIRLDKELEELLNTLDTEVGKGNYTLFLTADHGAADVPNYLKDLNIPAGYYKEDKLAKELKSFCFKMYGDSLVLSTDNQQVFLNEEKLEKLKMNKDEVEKAIANKLLQLEGVAEAFPSSVLRYEAYKGDSYRSLIANGYNHKRSGNVAFSLMPAWMDNPEKGTTHGAAYGYDTHVPLLFFGTGIKQGESVKNYYITEIAPTISILLNNPFPNGCTSKPVEEVLKK